MSSRVLELQLEYTIERLESRVEAIENGDIGFSEAGDYLHNHGHEIVLVLKEALNHVRYKS